VSNKQIPFESILPGVWVILFHVNPLDELETTVLAQVHHVSEKAVEFHLFGMISGVTCDEPQVGATLSLPLEAIKKGEARVRAFKEGHQKLRGLLQKELERSEDKQLVLNRHVNAVRERMV
jgi:hypothetical protein